MLNQQPINIQNISSVSFWRTLMSCVLIWNLSKTHLEEQPFGCGLIGGTMAGRLPVCLLGCLTVPTLSIVFWNYELYLEPFIFQYASPKYVAQRIIVNILWFGG